MKDLIWFFLVGFFFNFPFFLPAELVWGSKEIEIRPIALVEEVKASFSFTNLGEMPITISNIQSSCGCTTVELAKKRYEPKERGQIDAVFTVGSRTGFQQKLITVTTDSSTQPLTQLMLKVYLPEILKFEPNTLEWKLGASNVVNQIEVKSMVVEPVKLIRVASSSPEVEVNWKEIIPNKTYQIEVKLRQALTPLYAILRIEARVGNQSKWFSLKAVAK